MVTDDPEVADLYSWACRLAERRVRRPADLVEAARDAVTDAIVYAVARRDRPGDWPRYARNVVRLALYRFVGKATTRLRQRAKTGALPPNLPAPPAGSSAIMTAEITELPAELRDAVRLCMIDGYTLRDAGLLLGIAPETVRTRLKQAARALYPDAVAARRRNGEKRHRAG